MATARLQLSILEAQDVQGDWLSPLKYYVKLRTNQSQARTGVVRAKAPCFLEDVRLHYIPDEKGQHLEFALLQVGDHGDLVVGTHILLPTEIEESNAEVQWLTLTDPERTQTGKLAVVVRELPPLPSTTSPTTSKNEEVCEVARNEREPDGLLVESEASGNNIERQRGKFPFLKATAVSLTTLIVGIGHLLLNRPNPGMPFEDPCDIFPSLSQCVDRYSLITSMNNSPKTSANT